MAFVKKDWQYNDIITEGELNRIEQGIVEANQKADQNTSDLASHLNDFVPHGLGGMYRRGIYVSMNGNDETGTGTTNNPYRSLQKAIGQIPIGGAGEIFIIGTTEQSPYVIDSEVVVSRRLLFFPMGPCYIRITSSGRITLFNAVLTGFYTHVFYIEGECFRLGGGINVLNFGGFSGTTFVPLHSTANVTVFLLARGTDSQPTIAEHTRPVLQTINGFRVIFRTTTVENYSGTYKVFDDFEAAYRSGFVLFKMREMTRDPGVDWGFTEFQLGGGVSLFTQP